ncbi:MAG: hypothetical protein COY66_03120 [Candidatus Kerfeldbacteria bacterium CG_4_10_14_0_8_um_filter_42_10]|uniref:Uncharacterized protein n=1 Tax=Candidatus Kerfeldbacteria bacterium CG_4_10_14_0_8_um_filter_42_10 TaxID=2014248 RepID=A0A2M7RJ23_9BACT|nr:MAG: hypothetical protein COY66_03120 [Candidatus Kerfeldbacteria bacterium CG_4_10_14_0_8_um_filter_42_10]
MLNIPKSTLATWFSELNWSQEIKKELTRKANYIAKKRLCIINKARRESWERWREQARIQARKNFVKLKNNPLFIAGVMLYWGEGDSKIENSIVRLSNTNPQLIKMFSLFLQKTCGVPKEKIKIALILYPDLNEGKCHQFWSQVTNIPSTQFRKTQYIKGRHPTKRLTNGICMVNVSSRELKEKIFVWIEKFYKLF